MPPDNSKPLHADAELCAYILSKVTASVPLQIRKSDIPGAGTGLFAGDKVPEGEEIYRSNGFVSCVLDESREFVCDYCFASSSSVFLPDGHLRLPGQTIPKPKACASCMVCYYCSKECQKLAWKAYHKLECQIFKRNKHMHARTRLLWKIRTMLNAGLIEDKQFEAFLRLSHHHSKDLAHKKSLTYKLVTSDAYAVSLDLAGKTKGEHSVVMVEALWAAGQRVKSGLSMTSDVIDEALDYPLNQLALSILLTNCSNLANAQGQEIGTALDLVGSLMNHACEPNALVFYEGRQLRVRALRPLRAGEEITMNYTDPKAHVLTRQPALKTFFIDCKCPRCKAELEELKQWAPDKPRWSQTLKGAQKSLEKLEDNTLGGWLENEKYPPLKEFEAAVKKIITVPFPSGDWPDDLSPMSSIIETCVDICEYHDDYMKALKYRTRACLSLKIRKGPTWIHALFHLLFLLTRIAQLPSGHPMLRGHETFLPDSEFCALYYGYLGNLVCSAVLTYGQDTKYARGMIRWTAKNFLPHSDANARRPGTPGYHRFFATAQSKFLKWAGVDESKRVVLSVKQVEMETMMRRMTDMLGGN